VTAKQKLWVNKIRVAKFYSMALKCATSEYSKREKLAEQVEMETKIKCDGVGPTAQTITQYANKLKLVGVSPHKVGTKGSIPQWVFKTVCTAFLSLIKINQLNVMCAENHCGKLSQRLLCLGLSHIPIIPIT
jgi:hypothetical protein